MPKYIIEREIPGAGSFTPQDLQAMADLLVNTWQGALLRMKIEKSSAPIKQCCHDLLGDYFMP